MRTQLDDTIRCRFYAPVELALHAARSTRRCHEFPDEEYLEAGLGRVFAEVQSGRAWIQQLQMGMNSQLSVGCFFEALKSPRRLKLLQEIADHVRDQLDTDHVGNSDPLAQHPELDGYAVFASDGHYEMPCTHAPRIEGKAQPVGFFYTTNLRSHSLSLLDIARPVRKREHDMSVLKRLGISALRMDQPKGTKVIHVYDPAGIDYRQWAKWKAKGIYLISREKENSTAEVVGSPPWDQQDPRNIGILGDELVGVFSGVLLRRVTYRDPATGQTYRFITNEMNVPPGLIAFLYKLRWDIEKAFDEKKNKLQEKKAWANSPVAHTQQALFICLAHNLMLLFEQCLEAQEGIRDEKVRRKRQRRAEQVAKILNQRGDQPNPLVAECQRATQRSLQFIRWLRHCLMIPTSWSDGMAMLRPLMAAYLN